MTYIYEDPSPRGTIMGKRSDGRLVPEAEHFFRCVACGGWIDGRDWSWVQDHQTELPHPACDQTQ
jgi:hypothetical protein